MEENVIVLGAGFAGINSALGLSRRGYDVTLVDMNGSHEFTPGIIDLFRDRVSEEDLKLDLEEFLSGTGIQFERELVERINPKEGVVHTGSGDYHYEQLVVALGADVKTNGVDISEALTVYSAEGAQEIKEELAEAEEVLIVGSGYAGVETAGELMERGLEVTVVDSSTRPMPQSPEKASHRALEYMNENGIKFQGGKKVIRVEEDGVETEEGDEIDVDLVIWAGGVEPSRVVRDSFDSENGLPVNSGLASEEHPEVFAAGDCADTESLMTAQNAERQGRLIAENLVRDEGESLESYEEGKLLFVSLGKTGMMIHGDRVIQSRVFRYLKDLVRLKYFLRLKYQRFRARFSRLL